MGAGRAVEAPFPRLAAEPLPVPHNHSGRSALERRRLGGGLNSLVATSLEARGFLAAFTERTGGVSPPPFDSLNLGILTDDSRERVLDNRRRTIEGLGVPPWAMGWQRHGAAVAEVGRDRAGAGFEDGSPVADVDGLVTDEVALPLAVLVADCLPIALADPEAGRLAVVHAGWRGLAAGVIERALEAFDRPPVAAIGPAIGPCHYEVGDEVIERVGSERAAWERRDGRAFLDLTATAARILAADGVDAPETANVCTACEGDRFFSHRRDGATGRQALVAMRLS